MVAYPLGCLAVSPAIPVFAGIAHRYALARGGTFFLAVGVASALTLLSMQLTIILG